MSAVSTQLEAAIVRAIENLNLTTGMTVVARKSPSLPAGKDPPGIAVVVGAENKSEPFTGTSKLKTYPVSVVIFLSGGHKTADDPETRRYRDAIEQQLDDKERVTFAGVVGFNRCTTGGMAPFDASALKADFIASIQTFSVEMIETRAMP